MSEGWQIGKSVLSAETWIDTRLSGVVMMAKTAAAVPDPDPAPQPDPTPEPQPDPQPDPDPAPEPQPDPAPDPDPAAPPVVTRDWKDNRINTLTARLKQAQRDLEAAKQQPQAPDPAVDPATPPRALSEAELEAEVERRAGQRVAAQEYTRRCNEVAAAGEAKFGSTEFRGRVASLVSLVDGDDISEIQAYHNLMVAALETGSAPEVLFELGGNLNEAQRLLALSPVAMGVAMAKMTASEAGAVSGAPRPIRPTTPGAGGARVTIDPGDPARADTLTTAEWMRRRNEQLARRGA